MDLFVRTSLEVANSRATDVNSSLEKVRCLESTIWLLAILIGTHNPEAQKKDKRIKIKENQLPFGS
jgi:hypothetical protein